MSRPPRRSRKFVAAVAALGVGWTAALTGAGVAGPAAAQPVPPTAVSPTTTAPFTTPNTDACPNRSAPPPPIDTSEVPRPGETTPASLPVLATPVGGPRLGECAVVLPAGAPPVPADLSATAWLIADLDSGQVLAAKDPHGRYRPASTIKVLLAAVALRTLDLDAEVVGTQEDANMEGTRVGIGPGGRYTNRQLMQALLMSSGNDAAHAIATQLGGDRAAVAAMNELAQELQAMDTRAATPSGLDGPGMSTSAYDLAVLFRDAMTIPVFAEMIGTMQADFPGFPADPRIPGDEDRPGFPIGNDNRLLYSYEGNLGGKTGFTDDARQTFVTAAERDGRRLVVTLLRAEVKPIHPAEQAARLLDYGFGLPADTGVGALPGDEPPLPDAGVAVAAPAPGSDAPLSADRGSARLVALTAAGLVGALLLAVGAWVLAGKFRM